MDFFLLFLGKNIFLIRKKANSFLSYENPKGLNNP